MYTYETTLYRAIVIAALIIGAILAYLVLSVVSAQRRFRRTLDQNVRLLISSIESERARFSCDLHDELGPVLSAVKFRLSSIELSEAEAKQMSQCIHHIESIVDKIREIAYNLTPAVLKLKGLAAAIENYIGQCGKFSDIRIDFLAAATLRTPKWAEIHVYRIIQEIIHNAMKHSRATRLQIALLHEGNDFVILASDDGCGFNVKAVNLNHNGQGLQNLYMRAQVLGGDVSISSSSEKGTRIQIQFPLNQQRTHGKGND